MRFTFREIKELLISTIIITFCFAWVHRDLPINFGVLYIYMFIVVGSAFALHELGHKISAQRFGHYAEYRMWEFGLLIAFVLAVTVNWFFIAPGAVYIIPSYRGMSREENGIISVSGIIVNISLSLLFYIGYQLTGLWFLGYGAMINAFLAFLNLLPIPPLDGSKVLTWNPIAWIVLIAVSFMITSKLW